MRGNAILSDPCNRSTGTAGFPYIARTERTARKEREAIQQIENKTYCRSTPTVEEYCEKWLLMQSAQIRMTTLIDYTSKVKNYIIKALGRYAYGDVTADDIRLALLAASKKSASVYKSVNVLYKCIFTAAMESKIIDEELTIYLKKNVGGIPQKDLRLTDEQVDKLLDAIYGLPPYVFVMLGLYAGLRREEIPRTSMGFRCILIARLRILPFESLAYGA